MSDLDFTPAEPLPEGEGIYDSLPESVVVDVLGRAGFHEEESSEEVAPEVEEVTPPVESDEELSDPPVAPGGPLFKDEEETPDPPDTIRLPDGRLLPLALVQEWADAQARPSPTFPQPPVATPTLPLPVSPPPSTLALPQITQEDIEAAGPFGQALLLIANRQAQELAEVRSQAQRSLEASQAHVRRENAEIANSAASSFKSQYNLPDDLMDKVKNTVLPSDLDAYLSRDPDPYKAVDYALTRAYWNLPEARQYEFERQTANREAATTRKRKLAGVSGSGGSGPRGTPAPDESTPEGLKAAAVELARAAMYGDQQ